jgi:uncharacterized protein (DUF58 family)
LDRKRPGRDDTAVRFVRNAIWRLAVVVGAAELVAVIATVSFGLALTIILFALAILATIVDGITSGDFAFLLSLRHRRGYASLGAVVRDAGPLDERALMFTTNDEARRLIKTDHNPVGIRFVTPVEQEVSKAPAKVKRAGVMILRVEQFVPDGIVISTQRPGIEVRAEVSYHHCTVGKR